jgi:hypothetical protein
MAQRGPEEIDEDEDEGGGFDLGMVRGYLGYAIRAVRLHRILTGGLFVSVVVLAFVVVRSLPKSYHVETRLLAQRDAMAGHGNAYGWDPLKGASEMVMSQEHLTSLVKQLDLTTWWRNNQAPAQKAKSAVMGLFFRPPTEDEQVRALVEMLDKKMSVSQSDNTVSMTIDWPSGEMAARILDTAEQDFLEKRHVLEISTIAESIAILQENAARVRKDVEKMAMPDKVDDDAAADKPPAPAGPAAAAGSAAAPKGAEPDKKVAHAPAPAVAAARKPARRKPEIDAELARQKMLIDTKQRAITDLEDFRQRRVLELQANLAEQKAKYTEQHPIIVGIQENIAAFSKESPQVASLRSEVKLLQETYDRMSREAEEPDAPAVARGGGGGAVATGNAGGSEAALVIPPRENRDPTMETQITFAVANYAKIKGDIEAARVDLDFAQAAFRHRYSVILPAEPPHGPSKPKVPLVMAAATVAALLLGVLAAVAAELRTGRLVARWQVEQILRLPVLAELRLPAGASPPTDPSA